LHRSPQTFVRRRTAQSRPVFRLLGARDLGRSDDDRNEKMPPVNEDMFDEALAWRQHDGGRTDGPNVAHFIRWAEDRWRQDKRRGDPTTPGPDRRSLKGAAGDRFKIVVGIG
jgi:hypothetical protein